MLHTKVLEKTIFDDGCGGNLGHVTKILRTKCQCHNLGRLHIKFQLDWPSEG